MGIQDRDYYREKRDTGNDSGGVRPSASKLPDLSWKYLSKIVLLWILIALIFFIIFNRYESLQKVHSQAGENHFLAKNIARSCMALPPHGSGYMFDPSINRTDVLYSGLQIESKHDHPMVAILTDPTRSKRFLAVSIAPNQSTQVSLPIGQYGMHILIGSKWCDVETGFSDGANVTVSDGISIKAGSTTILQFSGSGIKPVQLALAYSISKPEYIQNEIEPSEVIGVGTVDLLQTRDGHYFSSGTINGTPAVFMIDTGATLVSISTELASRSGIQNCIPHTAITGNGKVNACKATASELAFGRFKLKDVEVMVMPNMPGNALLGMNVLRNFHIEQADKVMRITSR